MHLTFKLTSSFALLLWLSPGPYLDHNLGHLLDMLLSLPHPISKDAHLALLDPLPGPQRIIR